ncbi:MAG: choice-of-anchor R domain-containing protein [Limisphaerales bacterium]
MSFTAFKSIFFPRNGSNLNVLGLAAVCFIIASQVRGSDVIYGNYDPNNILQTISNGNASGPQFGVSSYNLSESVPFTTDNNMYTVDSVELVISRLFGNTSDLTLSLYSDAGGTPGSSLGTFSNPANITQGGALFTATGLTLAPDTTYWIIAAPGVSEKSDFEWWNSLATGISGFSQFDSNANAWGSWSVSAVDNSPSFVVYGSPVPEPSALALFGFGAFAFGFLLRRHSRLVVSPAPVVKLPR